MSRRLSEDEAGLVLLAEFASRLRVAVGDTSFREVGRRAGLTASTVSRLLAGETAPDLLTVSRLERALGAELWPADLAKRQRSKVVRR